MSEEIKITKLIHYKNTVALINPTYVGNEGVENLVAEFEEGLPASWNLNSSVSYENILYHYSQNIFYSPDRRYVAKIRRFAHPDPIAVVKHFVPEQELVSIRLGFIKPNIDPKTRRLMFGRTTRNQYALDSLLNEINLAPILCELISSEEGKQIYRKYGISMIEFVQPIFGLINKNSGQKLTVYPNVGFTSKGDLGVSPFTGPRGVSQDLFAGKLAGFFLIHQIDAQDLLDRQLLTVNGNRNHLYLIDAEAYVQLPNLKGGEKNV
jgi:hypothetical protein